MKDKINSIEFHIKQELKRYGIIVHRNIDGPTTLFFDENDDAISVDVKTFLLPIDSCWNKEAISEYIKEFFDTRGYKNFSFHSIDSFKRCEEKGGEPVERLKIRFASW